MIIVQTGFCTRTVFQIISETNYEKQKYDKYFKNMRNEI